MRASSKIGSLGRADLKGMGLLDNSKRGVWSTTERGRSATEADLPALDTAYVARKHEARKKRKTEADESETTA